MKNKILNFLFLVIFSISFPQMATAQGQHRHGKNRAAEVTDANIAGHVLESATDEHIPFVNIQLKGTSIGSTSDESGHFFLKNLPLGEQTLVFSMVGYTTIERVVNLEEDVTLELNLSMEEASFEIDNVVVTANKYETKQKESVSIVNVISPFIFEATSSNSMAEVLNYQTGLRVEVSCQNCGVPELRINGLEGQYSQILMDSRPIFSSLASVYGLEQIPTGMVDRVEVIRGGGSALYGSNAIGGVVNIITKEPVRNFVNLSNHTDLIGGKSLDFNTTLNGSFVTANSKIGVFLFGVHRNRDSYDRDNDGFSEIPVLNSSTVGFRSYFKTSNYSKITADYHHSGEYRRGGDNLNKPPHEAEIAEQVRHNIDAGSVKFDYFTPDSKHFISAYASSQYVGRESYFGTQKDLNAYGTSRDFVIVSGAQYRYSMEKFLFMPADLSAGVEYSYNKLHDEVIGYGRNLNQEVHLYGGYLQNEWKNSKLSILIGARLEKHNLIKRAVATPRANFRYTPIENVVLRVSYSSGYRAPQAYEEDLHIGAVGGEVSLITIDPNLKPEYSHSVSGSVDLYKRWGQWDTNLTLEGFFTQLNDVFTLVDQGYDALGNLLLLRTNASGARVGGLNIEGKLSYRRLLSVQLGYTYQKSWYLDPVEWSNDPTIAPQNRMFRTPDSYGYGLINVNPVKNFSISLNGKYTGKMLVQHFAGFVPQDAEVETKPFWDLGFKLAYEIPFYRFYTLEINAGMKNVLDSFQPDIDKGANRDAGYIYGPSLPRSYFIGINLKI